MPDEITNENMPYRPILPPMAGYIETDGKYVPTLETTEKLRFEELLKILNEQLGENGLTGDGLTNNEVDFVRGLIDGAGGLE